MIKTFENFKQSDFYIKTDDNHFEKRIKMPISTYIKLTSKLLDNDFICKHDKHLKDRLIAVGGKFSDKMVLTISVLDDEYYIVTYWIGNSEIETYLCDQLDGVYKLLYDKKIIKE